MEGKLGRYGKISKLLIKQVAENMCSLLSFIEEVRI